MGDRGKIVHSCEKRAIEFVNQSNEPKWQNSVRDIVHKGIPVKPTILVAFQRNPLHKGQNIIFLLLDEMPRHQAHPSHHRTSIA